jgi:hypothetical protein
MHELLDRTGYSHEIKLILGAVINIYTAHLHSLLYPYNHPLVSDSLKNAFDGLQKAFRKNPQVRLETVGEKLMVNGELLNDNALFLRYLTAWLNSMNIKALSFKRELTRREITSFHKIISTQKLSVKEILKAMAEKSIINMSIHQLDSSDAHTTSALHKDAVHKGLVNGYESTMYHMGRNQSQSSFFLRPTGVGPHEDAANYGLTKEYEIKMDQQASHDSLSLSSTSFAEDSSVKEMEEGPRGGECVEALIEREITEDECRILRRINPMEMAHLLNAMLFRAPDSEVADRVFKAYFDRAGEIYGDATVERYRIFLASLKANIRPPFLSRCASIFGTNNLLASRIQDILPEAVQETYKPSLTESDNNMSPEQPPFVPCRTIEGCDFSFDFAAFGNAVLHDIEIPKEFLRLFNKAHIARFQTELKTLSPSARNAACDAELQASIIAEYTDEAITEAAFDVMIEILESKSLDDDMYKKLEGRLTAFVELFSENGEFDKILEMFNSLKTQSLQGKWSAHATSMIRRIFSTERVNTKIVDAVRRYGRKQRENVFKLMTALRSFIIPYLLDALCEEPDTSTRRFIMSIVTSVRSDAVDHIAKRLRDSSWYVSRNMLYLLRECHGRSHASAVRGFLEHEVPLVRLEALRTLLSFQSPDADAYVIEFLSSDVFQLRKGAIRLAGAYRIKYTVPHLVRLLMEKDIIGKKYHIKKGIIRALGRIGDSRAVGHLLNFCRSTSGIHKDEFDKLKFEIFKTLHNYSAATIGPLINYGMQSSNKEIVAISKKLSNRYSLSARKPG